ncbi:hypothetical protein PF011_g27952 [Phytophthora fragariae]|uniref:Secreted protein n=1 Tax=Phytophthora fragariae TaxID=53985 RepID=A0A6A3HBN5_9STRA|nr:hypothetical protein PF011_g27952 [Phytophthora fragariae]KAE9281250.1 hypothetical protein PF008_g27930 [Phytophthora fragariae]
MVQCIGLDPLLAAVTLTATTTSVHGAVHRTRPASRSRQLDSGGSRHARSITLGTALDCCIRPICSDDHRHSRRHSPRCGPTSRSRQLDSDCHLRAWCSVLV